MLCICQPVSFLTTKPVKITAVLLCQQRFAWLDWNYTVTTYACIGKEKDGTSAISQNRSVGAPRSSLGELCLKALHHRSAFRVLFGMHGDAASAKNESDRGPMAHLPNYRAKVIKQNNRNQPAPKPVIGDTCACMPLTDADCKRRLAT